MEDGFPLMQFFQISAQNKMQQDLLQFFGYP